MSQTILWGNRGIVTVVRPKGGPADRPTHPARTFAPRVHLSALAVDGDDYVWGAGPGGLVRWDARDVIYRTWHAEHGLAGSDLSAVLPHGGRVYVGHQSGAVSVLEGDHIRVLATNLPGAVRALAVEPEFGLLAATAQGLSIVEGGQHIETPHPPTWAVMAFGTLWIGTTQGLYRRNGTWERVGEMTAVHKLLYSSGHLWAVADGAFAVVNKAGKSITYPLQETVIDAAPGPEKQIYVLTDATLYRVAGKAVHPVGQASGARFVAVTDNGYVLADTREAVYHSPANLNPVALSPYSAETLGSVMFFSPQVVQDETGGVWQLDKNENWVLVSMRTDPGALTVVVPHENGFLLGGTKGLTTLKDDKLERATTAVQFVVALAEHAGKRYALATLPNERSHTHLLRVEDAGIDAWVSLAPLPPDAGVALSLVFIEGVPVVLTANGRYILDAGRLRVLNRFSRPMIAADGTHSSDGKRLFDYAKDTGDLPPILFGGQWPRHTAVATSAETIFVGTRNGLLASRGTKLQRRLTAADHGLAANHVVRLWAYDGAVYVLTTAGLSVLREDDIYA